MDRHLATLQAGADAVAHLSSKVREYERVCNRLDADPTFVHLISLQNRLQLLERQETFTRSRSRQETVDLREQVRVQQEQLKRGPIWGLYEEMVQLHAEITVGLKAERERLVTAATHVVDTENECRTAISNLDKQIKGAPSSFSAGYGRALSRLRGGGSSSSSDEQGGRPKTKKELLAEKEALESRLRAGASRAQDFSIQILTLDLLSNQFIALSAGSGVAEAESSETAARRSHQHQQHQGEGRHEMHELGREGRRGMRMPLEQMGYRGRLRYSGRY